MDENRIIRPSDFDKRPFWFNGINRFWQVAYAAGLETKLSKDDLIRSARKATRASDFGRDFQDEPLDRLLYSIKHEANLHPIGRFITKKRLVSLLSIRLRAEWWFKRHPEILEAELYPVTVIVGLQRTGTTKLHRLLAADPDNRALISWEAINPVPLNGDFRRKDKRVSIASTSEKALKLMAPGFFSIHPVEHLAPEEDILLLDATFLSTTPEATMHVPTYAKWLEETDQSTAYEYAAKLLKFLQWQKKGERWILKSPHHLEFMPEIKKHLGSVNFLWTHRDLHTCIPSFLSMVLHSQVIFSNHVDPVTVADHWVRKTGYMLNKGMEFREDPDNASLITDIHYDDITNNAQQVLDKVYSGYGGISKELREIFIRTEQENPKGKYGTHQYSGDDFGITRNDLHKQVHGYTVLYDRFKRTIN